MNLLLKPRTNKYFCTMKNLCIASTSTLHGSGFLTYLLPQLEKLFNDCSSIVFIPYARPGGISYDDYTQKVSSALAPLNLKVYGLHEFENPIAAIKNAEGLFTGGGNTFELVHQLYQHDLMQPLKEVLESGTPYLGTSAGSNICGVTMMTTNDMPIVYPQSFDTLGIFPFNINAHYLDPRPNSTHMGETRATRIQEFHVYNTIPVVGLREGSWLQVTDRVVLCGPHSARLFEQNKTPRELPTGTELVF